MPLRSTQLHSIHHSWAAFRSSILSITTTTNYDTNPDAPHTLPRPIVAWAGKPFDYRVNDSWLLREQRRRVGRLDGECGETVCGTAGCSSSCVRGNALKRNCYCCCHRLGGDRIPFGSKRVSVERPYSGWVSSGGGWRGEGGEVLYVFRIQTYPL